MGFSLSRRRPARALPTAALSRRGFLRAGMGATGGVGLATLAACGGGSSGPAGSDTATPSGLNLPNRSADAVAFRHGVASGDPTATAVVLWTRVSPLSGPLMGPDTRDFEVLLTVADDAGLTKNVRTVALATSATRDHTVKHDLTGLQPGRTYFYRFSCNGTASRVGRTRTAPEKADALKFGVVSCSSLAHGYFHAYRMLVNKSADLDAVVHLGDYIYEYGTGEYGDVRAYKPATEMVTLSDYRTRHGQYKEEDMDLQDLHASLPFITIWDDHESADNSYNTGANNHTEGAEGVWAQRKAWAQQAYDEWMPIRTQKAADGTPDPSKIWRRLSYGNLAEWVMLDTRLWARTPQAQATAPANTAGRLLGEEQSAFLLEALKKRGDNDSTWRLIGNQVVFHPWVVAPGLNLTGQDPTGTLQGTPLQGLPGAGNASGLNADAWDGYPTERQQVLDFLRSDQGQKNTVILTGDVHSCWVADVTENPNQPVTAAGGYNPVDGTGSAAVEFVVTSVTSPGLPIPNEAIPAFRASNPHIKYINLAQRGYALLTVTAQKVECAYFFVSDVTVPATAAAPATESAGPVYSVSLGAGKLDQQGLTA